MHSVTSVELRKKINRPPGRASRAASGIQRNGSAQIDAPYSEWTMSKDSSGSGTSSPYASTNGNSRPVCPCMRRAVSSCAGVGSTPTTRAPRRASQAEKYAVPQPSSTMSRPSTSPRRFSSHSGFCQMPQLISSAAHDRSACASVYSALARVQLATFAST
ncbi:MAG: hypothetical protein AUG91_08245 [Actinobacteria bacterium 13_1_20CM_4_69_9]|nr:MAG: hypothetical protein AUG91_08245 [Actinobacteria bacterium 13_1_20CM_4_69_9]